MNLSLLRFAIHFSVSKLEDKKGGLVNVLCCLPVHLWWQSFLKSQVDGLSLKTRERVIQLSQNIRQGRATMSVLGTCNVGYRITAPFWLQIRRHLDQHVYDVHIEAQLLGLSYLKQSLGFYPLHSPVCTSFVPTCLVAMRDIHFGMIHRGKIRPSSRAALLQD